MLVCGAPKVGKSVLMNALAGAFVAPPSLLGRLPFPLELGDGPLPMGSEEDVESVAAAAVEGLRRQLEDGRKEARPEPYNVELPLPPLERSGVNLLALPSSLLDEERQRLLYGAGAVVLVVPHHEPEPWRVEQLVERHKSAGGGLFVVINVDAQRRELEADGSLRPAADGASVGRMVERFRESFSPELRGAIDAGRVRLYAVDLLASASATLASGGDPASAGGGALAALSEDLCAHLNELIEPRRAVKRTLTRVEDLLEDLFGLSRGEPLRDLRRRLERSEHRRKEHNRTLNSMERLRQLGGEGGGWTAALERVRERLDSLAQEPARRIADDTVQRLADGLEEWLGSGGGVRNLNHSVLEPELVNGHLRLASFLRELLLGDVGNPAGLALLPAKIQSDLQIGQVPAARLARDAASQLVVVSDPPKPDPLLSVKDFPMRKRGLGDWLLMRGQDSLRRRVFGTKEAPLTRVTKTAKQSRLAHGALEALREVLTNRARTYLAHAREQETERIFAQFTEGHAERLSEHLTEKIGVLSHRVELLDAEIVSYRDRLDRFRHLEETCSGLLTALGPLHELLGDVEPEDDPGTLLPQPPPVEEGSPALEGTPTEPESTGDPRPEPAPISEAVPGSVPGASVLEEPAS